MLTHIHIKHTAPQAQQRQTRCPSSVAQPPGVPEADGGPSWPWLATLGVAHGYVDTSPRHHHTCVPAVMLSTRCADANHPGVTLRHLQGVMILSLAGRGSIIVAPVVAGLGSPVAGLHQHPPVTHGRVEPLARHQGHQQQPGLSAH